MRLLLIGASLLAMCAAARPQDSAASKPSRTRKGKSAALPPRVLLTPRLVPGQKLRYEMEFETTTATSRSGVISDPQGPSSLVVDWNATVRMEVLPPDAGAPGGIRLRTTYEKSTADVRSDSYDPAAFQTREQYQKLQGKTIEFTLDSAGKVKSIFGIEGIVEGEKAAQAARQWIAQFGASAGAPAGGVGVGQTWSSEEPANSLPIAGLVWRSDAEYVRNEPCHPPNPDLPLSAAGGDSSAKPDGEDMCAVVLTHLNLIRSKALRDVTPEDLRKNGVQTEGTWSGSGEGLTYVSLVSGLVVSVTQTGTEQMDVTLKTNRSAFLHYAGTISSRSHVTLVADELKAE